MSSSTATELYVSRLLSVFGSGLHRVGPLSPVCWCEPGLSTVGAQQGATVHPVPLLALPHAPELYPAGQRRLPDQQTFHGTRSDTVPSLLGTFSQTPFSADFNWIVSSLGSVVHPNPNFPLVPHVRHQVNLNFIPQKK